MMAASGAEQDDWVRRVLGVTIPWPPDAPGARTAAKLLPTWMAAREAIDGQVAALQAELRSYDHPDFTAIAEYGFNALTDGRSTRLMAALTGFDRQPGRAQAAAVAKALDTFGDLLAPGSVLEDYDANPFGVPVRLGSTLRDGIEAVRRGLQTGLREDAE